MLTWLEVKTSAATTQDWVIAYWHHPPYSKGTHDSDTELELVEMRENVIPILDQYGVDLTFAGHSHGYERSYLIDGHYGDSTTFLETMKIDAGDGSENGDGAYQKSIIGPDPHSGIVHTVAGNASHLNGLGFDHPTTVVGISVLGSVVLDVNDNRLDFVMLDNTGAVRDDFTIFKDIWCPNDPDRDIDDDGICGDVDNCPNNYNPTQADADGDGLGTVCDPCNLDPDNDIDADGICGNLDNCPATPNAGQEDGDADGIGDACDGCPADPDNDIDGDGVCGDVDNCPINPNPAQADADGDGAGDACDACGNDPDNDVDADGVCGDVDNCPTVANATQVDSDTDGAGDACDACPLDPADDADSRTASAATSTTALPTPTPARKTPMLTATGLAMPATPARDDPGRRRRFRRSSAATSTTAPPPPTPRQADADSRRDRRRLRHLPERPGRRCRRRRSLRRRRQLPRQRPTPPRPTPTADGSGRRL